MITPTLAAKVLPIYEEKMRDYKALGDVKMVEVQERLILRLRADINPPMKKKAPPR